MHYEQLNQDSGVNWAKESRPGQVEWAELSKLGKPTIFYTMNPTQLLRKQI